MIWPKCSEPSPGHKQTIADKRVGGLGCRTHSYGAGPRVWLNQLRQDVRYGPRTLRRDSGFASVVIVTLAPAIGMNTAVISAINAVLLRPLGHINPERLVWMANHDEFFGQDTWISRADCCRPAP